MHRDAILNQGLSISDLVFSGGPRDILKFFLGSGPVLDIGLNSAKLQFKLSILILRHTDRCCLNILKVRITIFINNILNLTVNSIQNYEKFYFIF